MAIVEFNWNPSKRQLRQFAAICLLALPLLGRIWGAGIQAVGLLALIGALLAIAGFVAPVVVRPVFLALTIVTTPIGMVIGEIVMLFVYLGVFLPIGMYFRLTGRDALQLKIDRRAKTYWRPKRQANRPSHYYRQS